MSKLEQAARQALEALEGGLWDYGPGQDEHDKCNEVITALREALAEQAAAEFWQGVYPDGWTAERVEAEMSDYHMILDGLDGLICHVTGGACSKPNTDKEVIKALHDDYLNKTVDDAIEDYKAEQAEQEPVGNRIVGNDADGYTVENLYAAPVRTVDLTDDEIDKVLRAQEGNLKEQWFFDFARAVIAADREKNQ